MTVPDARHPLVRPRRRGGAAVLVTALLGLAVPAGAAGAAVGDGPATSHEVDGTVVYVVADPLPEDDAEHFHEGSQTQAYAEVDGVLLDLSAVQAPVVGTDEPPVDGLAQGTEVVVTIAADAGLDETQAVAAAATPADPRAEVVDAEVVDPGTAAADLTATAGLAPGVHQLVVLPVRWDAGATSPTTALQAAADGTATYWERQSSGRVDIQTTVRPSQVVARPATCDESALMAAALAANPGITPTTTQHVAVYFPRDLGCTYAGRATIGGGSIWLNGYTDTYVLAHEFGHNAGLGHANTLTCTSGGARVPLTALSGCSVREYGDNADVMGQGRSWTTPGNISVGFAQHLGWATVADLGAASPATTLDLAPLASTTALRGVRVLSDVGPVFADFRPAVGPDAVHEPGWAGVQAHLVLTDSRYRYPTSYLLDLQPARSSFASPQLPAGASWAVPGGPTLTTVSTGATARVTVGPGAASSQIQRYVTRVYADLFNRQPDPTGLAGWTGALLTGTPRIAVANAITYSDEYRARLIAGSYQTYLGRGPDPTGAANWLAGMRGGSTIQQMESGFIASDEYYAKAGGTDAAWVARLYQHVLGRNAAPAEVQGWTTALARGASRSHVAMGFLVSTEHLTTVVDGYYVDLLGRGIDPSGARSWVTAIQSGARVEAIIGGIIASQEYLGKV